MMIYLKMLIEFLDKGIKTAADVTGLSKNKHFLTGAWIMMRYYPELVAASKRTDNDLDDKIVEELYQASQQFWPIDYSVSPKELPSGMDITAYVSAKVVEEIDFAVAAEKFLKALKPADPTHQPEDPDTGPHSD